MAITNQKTVTIKMTRGMALRLCRLILSHAESLRRNEYSTLDRAADDWMAIHDKVRAGVDDLDKKEVTGDGRPFTEDPTE